MAVLSLSKIQIRRGRKNSETGLPQLASGELAWAIDTRELFIGNGAVSEGAPAVGNTRVLTEYDVLNNQFTYNYINSNTTLMANTSYLTDSSGGGFIVALPINPNQGEFVVIADGANWAVNNVTVNRNGSTIEGNASNAVLDISETIVTFIYDGTTWQLFSTAASDGSGSANSITATNDVTTNPLYPVMVDAAGTPSTAKVSTSKIYFNASTGTIYATAKSFNIPHPTKPNKKLIYGSLEGPENGVYLRGRIKDNIIELPEYWNTLVDVTTTTVQLTPIGTFQDLFVKEINENNIVIDINNKDSKIIDCFFTVFAERKDIPRLQTEV